MHTVTLNIPVMDYGAVATGAAMNGVDISRYLANKLPAHVAARLAALRSTPATALVPVPAPAPKTTQPA